MTSEEISVDRVLCECRKYCGGSKKYIHYEAYKKKVANMNLSSDRYEDVMGKVSKIIGC